jgi:DNA topoisomerase-1
MARPTQLVIVESPAKATTIKKYLGEDFDVVASFGHVRDLPKSKLGIDVEHGYEPQYIIPRTSTKHVQALKKAAAGKDVIWLATDLDREGEAISWHVAAVLADSTKKAKFNRITFNEITKPAILEAVKKPREIDQGLVDAQQARRVLDRLVGYTLSPLLWKKIMKGLSAGRVQSAALKMVVDRERERQAFKPEEYFSIAAALETAGANFSAEYIGPVGSKKIITVGKAGEAEKIATESKAAAWSVVDVVETEQKQRPVPPFTTSTLQQAASNRLGFTAKRTMSAAQKLYEAGHITYMRTDSQNLSTAALQEIRTLISKEYGDEYLPDAANHYKSRGGAQEAHEAVRPTHVRTLPDTVAGSVGNDESKLYELIWRRTVACQMKPATVSKLRVDLAAAGHLFRATGLRVLFDGFRKASGVLPEEVVLPALKVKDAVNCQDVVSERHETQPPARFTEASLIKALEQSGIGRPSTYAPTLATLYARNYIVAEAKALVPQEVGFMVIDMLSKHFPQIVDADFTARMEGNLDVVADGKEPWAKAIDEFWQPFSALVKEKESIIEKINTAVELDEKCPECGKNLLIRTGRFGKFKACSGFPDCRYTEQIKEDIGVKCPACGESLNPRKTKRGKTFFGCSGYPKCSFALWQLTPAALAKKIKDTPGAYPHLKETETAIAARQKGEVS